MALAGENFLILFFCIHYGFFCMIHGVFVMRLFGGMFRKGAPLPSQEHVLQAIQEHHLEWAIIGLIISHGFSFVWNYLRGGEYREAKMMQLMESPYSRIVVLHLTLLASGFIIMALGQPLISLLILIALKIAFDVKAHLRERTKFSREQIQNAKV